MLFNLALPKRYYTSANKSRGFTLIEVIIGMVVFAISLSIVIQLIAPAERNSADQIHQIKGAELAQALIDDIMSRSFDENSDRAGGIKRCDEDKNGDGSIDPDTETCTTLMGPDVGETSRSLFDDVDDFNNFNLLVNATDENLDGGYATFELNVQVQYDGLHLRLANRLVKSIYVVVTTPLGTDLEFTVFKSNF